MGQRSQTAGEVESGFASSCINICICMSIGVGIGMMEPPILPVHRVGNFNLELFHHLRGLKYRWPRASSADRRRGGSNTSSPSKSAIDASDAFGSRSAYGTWRVGELVGDFSVTMLGYGGGRVRLWDGTPSLVYVPIGERVLLHHGVPPEPPPGLLYTQRHSTVARRGRERVQYFTLSKRLLFRVKH